MHCQNNNIKKKCFYIFDILFWQTFDIPLMQMMERFCVEVCVCLIGCGSVYVWAEKAHFLCNSLHVLLACQLHCPLFLHITPPLTPSFFQLVPLFFFIHFSPSPFLSLPLFRPHSSLHINTFVITHLIPPATLHSPSNTSTEAHKGEKKRTKEHFCDFVPCLNKLAVAKYSVLLWSYK